jgi:exosome complex component CSL4
MAGTSQGPLLVCTGDLLGSTVSTQSKRPEPPAPRRSLVARSPAPSRPLPPKNTTPLFSQDAFSPGPGTYERAGNIYASLVGSLVRHDAQQQQQQQQRRRQGEDADAEDEDDDEDDPRHPHPRKPLLAVTSARALPLEQAASTASADPPSAVVVPRPGDVVTGRVTRVGPSAAQVALLCVGSSSGGGSRGSGLAPPPAATAATLSRVLPTFPSTASPYPGASLSAAPGAFRGVVRRQDVRRTDIDGVVMRDCFRPGDVVRCAVLSLGDSRAYFLSTAANELGVVAARSATSGEAMVPVSWQEMACPLTGAVERRKVAKVG